jgi:hypothetical protein
MSAPSPAFGWRFLRFGLTVLFKSDPSDSRNTLNSKEFLFNLKTSA